MSLTDPLAWPLTEAPAIGLASRPMQDGVSGDGPTIIEDDGIFGAGKVASAYDRSLAITGGTPPYVFVGAVGTPPGLAFSIDGTSLRLQGTPTIFAEYPMTVTLADSGDVEGVSDLHVVINRADFMAARFVGDDQWAQRALTLGGVGCINFEIQALVYIDGARNSEERVFMCQFPASRQAGLFAANTAPHDLRTGDSQVGSTGGEMLDEDDSSVANPPTGVWCFLTFSCDGVTGTSGLMQASVESLDEVTRPYAQGGRTKGVEDSLQCNRVDLNGGGVPDGAGFANGIRYAEVRAYNAQQSKAQRQADKFNWTDFTDAVFWWRFSDPGDLSLSVGDVSGNNLEPTIVGGTLEFAPILP